MKHEYFHQTHRNKKIKSPEGAFDNLKKERGYADEELLAPLREFYNKHHRVPTTLDLIELSKKNLSPDRSTYYRRWGTLNAALKAAGLPEGAPSKTEWTLGDVRLKMKSYVTNFQLSKPGQFPTTEDITRDASLGLCPPLNQINRHYKGIKRCYQVLFGKLKG